MARANFGSSFGVLVAMAGSAIGLGNLWRFPYMVGSYGGAAFIVVYIFMCFVLCLPILISEVLIGRRSGANAFGAFRILAPGTKWKWVGAIIVMTPIILLSYYCVIGGWSIEYFLKACSLDFTGGASQEHLGRIFADFTTSVWPPIICHTVFLGLTALIVVAGVKKGIELFGKVMMPLLFVLVIIMTVRSVTLPGAGEGLVYLFKPDFSKIDTNVCMAALGQAFFSLSLGVGTMLTYGSYIRKEENLVKSCSSTALADFFFALLASCAIMPAVFAFGLNPSEGPGLVFQTLPFIFSNMTAGGAVAIIFFLALLVAALTSSISMFEVGVAYLVEEKKMSRWGASAVLFVAAWAVGILCSLSFGPLADFQIMKNTIFNFLDKLTANYLMMFGAVMTVVFVGWKMTKADVLDELSSSGRVSLNKRLFNVIYFLIRYVCPAAVIAIFLSHVIFS